MQNIFFLSAESQLKLTRARLVEALEIVENLDDPTPDGALIKVAQALDDARGLIDFIVSGLRKNDAPN